jgi:thymidine phosphorylase
LRQKALQLAGRVIEFDPDVRGGQGYAIARDILDSGRAIAKMNNIIDAQGRQKRDLQPGHLSFEVLAKCDGCVTGIDNYQMARIARLAGAPMDKKAGVDLVKKLGDDVKKGEPLYRVYAEFRSDYQFAEQLCKENDGFQIGRRQDIPMSFVAF